MRWRPVLLTVGGGALYGICNHVLGAISLPGSAVITVRPQILFPQLVGLLGGPWAGLLAGGFGNLLGDILNGHGGTYWNWCIANGMLGGMTGWLRFRAGQTISTIAAFSRFFLALLGIHTIALLFACTTHFAIFSGTTLRETLLDWCLPAILSNVLLTFLLLPAVLLVLKYLQPTLEVGLGLLMLYVLVGCMVAAGVTGAAALTWTMGNASELRAVDAETLVRLRERVTLDLFRITGAAALLLVVVGFFASLRIAYAILTPIRSIMKAVDGLRRGEPWRRETLDPVASRQDELGTMARLLQDMGDQVRDRETELTRQLEVLRREADSKEVHRRVAEIAESDYFKSLQAQAAELRRKRHESR
ncbi:MAG: hypothetical protein A3K19_25380 [Lentisphaerae bacterium RIFOXYB12_FULL_65_16]|nr:MAG: hypothetical protein A3K18_22095 [Lentisphaerae bacterium RIFOXYA12_64_32]OGV87647.1 MAG: hypothetical protein A3K19_25380 [Lentisphaerae bacterium RIFOXYB12_FULL_65_16]